MPNTMSAKKAVRSSARKRENNLTWKKRIKNVTKDLDKALSGKDASVDVKKTLSLLQKILDKAAKEKAIHRNKANRVKSKYATKISVPTKKAAPKPRKAK